MTAGRYNRQEALWGREGQILLADSTLVIIGGKNLGKEVLKSASILGVATRYSHNDGRPDHCAGSIHLVDNRRVYEDESFLDIPLPKRAFASEELARIVTSTLNEDCEIIADNALCDPSYLESLSAHSTVDFIVDTSNDPESQRHCIRFSRGQFSRKEGKRRIPVLLACANHLGGIVRYYDPEECPDVQVIEGFGGQRQGIIMSNIFAGVIVEEYRKNLFRLNSDRFKDLPEESRPRAANGNRIDYFKVVGATRPLARDVKYSIAGDKRILDPREIDYGLEQITDGCFKDAKVLVLGCGALGNYMVDILARLGLERLDVMDFDVFEEHNLNRQPLGYDGVGRLKCHVLAEMVEKISKGNTSSTPLFAKIGGPLTGDQLTDLRKHKVDGKECKILYEDWFSENRYDVVIAGFDNNSARALMNSYAIKVGFRYIDAGSSPTGGKVLTYVPGKTKCLNCSNHIDRAAKASEKRAEENRLSRERQGLGCRFAEPSVNMSNQTTAGMAVAELRKLISDDYGSVLADRVRYEANEGQRLQARVFNKPCNCK
ncbi:ThiF family adenylyltransferase [Nanoarchaeota archaeon]